MKKVIFKNITMFFRHMIFFTYLTDNLGWDPTKDLIGCESFVYCRDKRVIQAVRQIQCFVRLGMVAQI